MKILVVEDEKRLNSVICKYLQKENFIVDSALDGEDALDFTRVYEYDLIILDIMMPKLSGYEFLQVLRNKNNNVPVLMLTAKDSIADKVKGLDMGADDYLIKPFEFEELLARMRALLRRSNNVTADNYIYLKENIFLDLSKKAVFKDEAIVELTGKEYEILEYLSRNNEIIMSREKIKDHVWSFDNDSESNVIDVMIKNLRKKLDENKESSIIRTKRGLGYYVSIKK